MGIPIPPKAFAAREGDHLGLEALSAIEKYCAEKDIKVSCVKLRPEQAVPTATVVLRSGGPRFAQTDSRWFVRVNPKDVTSPSIKGWAGFLVARFVTEFTKRVSRGEMPWGKAKLPPEERRYRGLNPCAYPGEEGDFFGAR